jgi:hypothetical protein
MESRSRGQPYSQDLRDRVLAMGHRQVAGAGMTKGALGRATGGDTRSYAAMATPVTSAQVVNA